MKYPMSASTWGREEENLFHIFATADRHTMGPKTEEFEQAFAKKFGVKHALFVSSGSMANLVALSSLIYSHQYSLSRGDEVIVPAISWATTYYPLMQYGLKLIFVDVDLETLNMDVQQVRHAVNDRTKMIVSVNILGNPCEQLEIANMCEEENLIWFEDNCESMGASFMGMQCGTFGDIGTFSTFFSHHISTVEGGLIVTDDKDLYDCCKSLRAHGWTRDIPDARIFKKGSDDFYEKYRFILPGYNARPQELNAAIGIEQLKKLDSFLAIRRQNAVHFQELFKDDERFIIQRETCNSSWFAFTMICNPICDVDRDAVLRKLALNGIEHRIVTGGCFPRHDVIKYADWETAGVGERATLPNANMIHDNGFIVGNYAMDLRESLDQLHHILEEMTLER